jgi:hypothetical protein
MHEESKQVEGMFANPISTKREILSKTLNVCC